MSHLLIITVILAYFLMLFGVSYLTSYKADNNAFFTGDRKSPWYVVAIAMVGTSISGVTFISVPGSVVASQFSYIQMVFGFVTGYFVVAFLFVPLYYKLNLISIYEYLGSRFGKYSYKTGSGFFLISKMLGCGVRMYLTSLVLQIILFDKIGIPFWVNVAITIFIVWLYTFRGGVKTLVWTDMIQTLSLILTVILCIWFIAHELNLNFSRLVDVVKESPLSKTFYFEDSNDKRFFWKQFLAGVFTTVAMTGLDQDMMQKNLSCKNMRDAQKNVLSYGIMFLPINILFLSLGIILYMYAEQAQINLPENSDQVFPYIATYGFLPDIVGILFILGLIAAAFSSAGSALTSLTTSFTIDILRANKNGDENRIKRTRQITHAANAVVMAIIICVFEMLNNTHVIDAVYIVASYTYGPLLGLYMFGLFTKINVHDKVVPFIAIASPVLCYIISANSERWFNGYKMGYELLIVNALITIAGLIIIKKKRKTTD